MYQRGTNRAASRRAAERELDRAGRPGSEEQRRRTVLRAHQRQVLWIPWTLVLVGFWQLLAPTTLGHLNADLWSVPSGGRGPWFAEQTLDALRASLMTWSDLVSGALLVVLGWLALRPDRPVAWWGACLVGVWLLFAPILLWAPTAAGFVNATLVGLLVIALTVIIPGVPNEAAFEVRGPATPPGWSYNPSSWPQRAVLVVFAFAGLLVARYLAAYQLGYIDTVWDPLFGFDTGTRQVLDSDLSHSLPISDAGLGGIAYGLELLIILMGGTARWRTSPWLVGLFGILVIPLGLSHVALIMSMPIVVGAWCTLCFVAGLVVLPMVVLTVDEVVAAGQHLRQGARRGDRDGSWWRVLWLGGSAEGCAPDERTPELMDLPARPAPTVRASLWGASTPVALVAVVALGVWWYAAPGTFGVEPGTAPATLAHLGGTIVVVAASSALAEVLRPVRLVALPAGLVVAATVWLTGAPVGFAVAVAATGVVIAALSLPRGPLRESYGAWDGTASWPTRRPFTA